MAKVGEGKLGYTILTPTTPAVAHIVLHNVGPWYYKGFIWVKNKWGTL